MWVAGSTHVGEEAQCLEAQRELEATATARGQPPPLLVLAPRRPERFAQVAQWLVAQHATSVRSTSGDAPGPRTSVLLLIKVGNAPEAFVGVDITPQ
jgi:3-deoxy-D-manno-octulosonic-acid transferase